MYGVEKVVKYMFCEKCRATTYFSLVDLVLKQSLMYFAATPARLAGGLIARLKTCFSEAFCGLCFGEIFLLTRYMFHKLL